jgi:peroxisomal membrane protein 4
MVLTKNDVLRILKGISSGVYYGAKVRFMHSLVMSILFMEGTMKAKLRKILKLTIEHAIRLGVFVGVYKTVETLLRKLEGRKSALQCFVAGLIGSLVINLDADTPVNQQITLYIISRVIFGGAKTLQKDHVIPKFNLFQTISVVSWALVMYIYARDKVALQASMRQSMDFLYGQSDKYSGWTDYVPVYMPSMFRKKIEGFVVGSTSPRFELSP